MSGRRRGELLVGSSRVQHYLGILLWLDVFGVIDDPAVAILLGRSAVSAGTVIDDGEGCDVLSGTVPLDGCGTGI